ncbi:ethanolamine-phosphate cytidylyltransferase [Raphidocelis subcapitata]|uniref:ethanolamine-phosphate cytidylyltransferase n=1 Tax=Raphidocelis subcapitata TaxID=307507 RepID=A0A2V0P0Y5_9CHLO|nr:ethanolamine-phosphate cytidylyltransferase [Raphidocelis subcapitata]|eukprot:GBF90857.1 ethanolamine-phosphate cytidylyltransferase [Raphidocelis subcapitata]
MQTPPDARGDDRDRGNDRLVLACVAAGSLVAGAGLFWATKQVLDYYIPYQYHYRPGTLSGWLADALNMYSKRRRRARPVRVYMDGCFDMMHYGHANALRQAKTLGDVLVVGLIPDAEILKVKGPPVQNDSERYTMVEQVKWVDEIITGVPYDLSPEFMNELFTKHRIDYVIHGDDPCLLPDGTDAYAHAKKLGRFKLGHPLTNAFAETHDGPDDSEAEQGQGQQQQGQQQDGPEAEQQQAAAAAAAAAVAAAEEAERGRSPAPAPGKEHRMLQRSASKGHTRVSRFMPTSRRLVQFSEGKPAPDGGRTVYIDGAFDMFHPGHVEVLKLAKAQGDFLLVGLHSDEDVANRRGPHMPIMNVHERALSVLACRYVDEVVIGAPEQVDANLLSTFNIGLVVRGSLSETSHQGPVEPYRYSLAKERAMFRELPSPCTTTTRNIIERIVANRAAFEARNAKKAATEERYYASKDEAVRAKGGSGGGRGGGGGKGGKGGGGGGGGFVKEV